ncbi:hypothetical protein AAHH79_38960, partial [Burkholderia pseudomallei]
LNDELQAARDQHDAADQAQEQLYNAESYRHPLHHQHSDPFANHQDNRERHYYNDHTHQLTEHIDHLERQHDVFLHPHTV